MHIASKLLVQVAFLQGLALLWYQHATASSCLQATDRSVSSLWDNMLSCLDLLFRHSNVIQLMNWDACWQVFKHAFACVPFPANIFLQCSAGTFISRFSPGSARRAQNKNANMHPAFPTFLSKLCAHAWRLSCMHTHFHSICPAVLYPDLSLGWSSGTCV